MANLPELASWSENLYKIAPSGTYPLKLSIFGSSFPTFHPLTFPHLAAPGNVIGQNWTLSASKDGLYVFCLSNDYSMSRLP
jgi:hypothetical protein